MEKSNFFRYPREVVLGNLGSPKFARNCSISYSFREKQHFPFPPKLKMAAKKSEKSKFFRGARGVVLRTLM